MPLTWSETENIAWKTPIDGLGWSSPVIGGRQIWLTTATDEGHSLRAVCLDRDSGKIVHDLEVFHPDDPGKMHKKNSWASPTPILEGDRIYVHYGTNGTACLTSAGKIVWKNSELKYSMVHGCGGSPVLVDDLLIFTGLETGGTCSSSSPWTSGPARSAGRPSGTAWSLPSTSPSRLRWRYDGSVDQVISPGEDEVVSYETRTGKPLWRVRYEGGYSVVPRPVFGKGLIFLSSGYDSPVLLAIRPDGRGRDRQPCGLVPQEGRTA